MLISMDWLSWEHIPLNPWYLHSRIAIGFPCHFSELKWFWDSWWCQDGHVTSTTSEYISGWSVHHNQLNIMVLWINYNPQTSWASHCPLELYSFANCHGFVYWQSKGTQYLGPIRYPQWNMSKLQDSAGHDMMTFE
jgi:hypothetical protein